jgi:hypothetical protein
MTTASLPVDRPFFAYQHEWNSGARSRNRVLTKMRQAGADFFFAYEALNDALHTGRNQIFWAAPRHLPLPSKLICQLF